MPGFHEPSVAKKKKKNTTNRKRRLFQFGMQRTSISSSHLSNLIHNRVIDQLGKRSSTGTWWQLTTTARSAGRSLRRSRSTSLRVHYSSS